MEWQYPKTATLRINNGVDSEGYLITDEEVTPADQKTLSLRGFKVPASGEDASDETSSLQAVATVIFGLFGLEAALDTLSATAQLTAEVIEG